jgi:hypothetical protein
MVILDANNLDTKSLSMSTDMIKRSVILKNPLPSFEHNNKDSSDISSILNKIDQVEKDYDVDSDLNIDKVKVATFEDNVKKWVECDDKITELRIQLSKLNRDKNKYNKNIIEFMRDQGLEDITTSTGTIKFNKDNKPETLTDKLLREKLVMYFTNSAQAEDLHNFIKKNLKNRDIYKLERVKK